VFTGRYRATVDQKGRVSVPTAFRTLPENEDAEWKNAILTSGLDDCLFLYTTKEWNRLMAAVQERTSALPSLDVMLFQRLFAGSGTKVSIDRSYRIVIPQELREEAGLAGECVWVGAIDRCELWSLEGWDDYRKNNRNMLQEVWKNLSKGTSSAESHHDAQGFEQHNKDQDQ